MSGVDDATATALLTIDLDSLIANYRSLRRLSTPAECAAVVKADAYGLGMAAVAPALAHAGCKTFFVATLGEAAELRALLADATIYVLAGLQEGTASVHRELGLRPVLNSADEIEEWAAFSKAARAKLPAAIHIDSGMNRLGLSAAEVEVVAGAKKSWNAFELTLVMSHLACSDEPEHAKNTVQRKTFDALRAKLPKASASLANSAGILLGAAYHYDLVRPGIALYGGKASRAGAYPFAPVVRLAGRVLQVRDVSPGETIGYGATRTLKRPSRVAVLSVGYADGVFRALSVADNRQGLRIYFGSHPAPLIGRVSMDLITVDVTDVPHELARRGAWVELIGTHVAAHEFAAHAGTIDYEVLTNLGTRAARRYTGG
ncbi:alanine racemase [Methyloceanibacter sp.]|uniref:alanine racemase n=1 Tax=Methyloceanibacter sp. TaxID=1965321 RepID=UPI003D6CF7C3